MQVQNQQDDYQQLSDVEHVLLRTDMYLGPIERRMRQANSLNVSENKIIQKQVLQSEAQEQTFKEIIGNAADNVLRSRKAGIDPKQIEIIMNDQWVIVKNYGEHIPIKRNQQTGKWNPDLIFGNMRAGSNFNDNEERMYIGKNGIGAKATNIFSSTFMVECADPDQHLFYRQLWQSNMTQRGEPEITQLPPNTPGYTQISYSLDFKRFGVEGFDEESAEIYGAHAAALSYVCQLPVIFNGQTFQVKTLVDYAKMFFPINKSSAITYKDPQGSYDLCLVDTPNVGIHLSFVNGMITERGGVHVDAAYRVIVKAIVDYMDKAVKGIRLTKREIETHVSVFISCRLNQPEFDSQTKQYLKKPEPKIVLPEKVIAGVKKWQLIQILYNEIERKQVNKLNRMGGGRKKKGNWGKAEPANLAGTKRSNEATYILTEGDSADSYRLRFISQIPDGRGRDYYGSQPLRGKLPNTLNADFLSIIENNEIKAIINNLGLKVDLDYRIPENYRKLNYGRVLIMPDPDTDGKHILGLVLLFFMARYSSLVEIGYICFLRIPTVRVTINGQKTVFYTMSSYKRHLATLPANANVGHPEYFKGLGTSEDHHIKEDFANPRIVTFKMDEKAIERTLLAFHKLQADNRKQWVANFVNQQFLEFEQYSELPISTFIDYELIDYSIENIIRSIPEAIDGMKESQRKALFAIFDELKTKSSKIKVAQAASHAAKITNYKHGENSLADAIVTMTQDFPGSNNLPFFQRKGQFGTRNKGGKDSAHPRYISIALPWWIRLIYRKDDKRLETRIVDEGEAQECENFFPVLPMHLINGVVGIGTAYSTNIPSHNPLDIAFWYQCRLLKDLENMKLESDRRQFDLPLIRPWYRGFGGEIKLRPDGFTTEGRMNVNGDGSILVDELPVGMWTNDYREFLNELIELGTISDYDDHSTDEKVSFLIHKYTDGAPTMKKLRLISNRSYKNMTVLYRTEHRGIQPKIYSNVADLMEDFYNLRLKKYQHRKDLMISEIIEEIKELSEKARYIHAVAVDQTLEVRNRPEADILQEMEAMQLNSKWLDQVKTRELNKDRIPQLLQKIEQRTAEKTRLEQLIPEQIWYEEITEFITKYCQHEKCSPSTYQSCNPPQTITL